MFEMTRLHTVFEYSKIDQEIALNVEMIISFCFPHLIEMSDFIMLRVRFAVAIMTFMCCENVSFGYRLIPRILGVLLRVVFDCLI